MFRTGPCDFAMSSKTSRTFPGLVVAATVIGITSLPVRSLRTRFLTTPPMRVAFGTITWARSNVSIFGGPHLDPAHEALVWAYRDPVADANRPLPQQD